MLVRYWFLLLMAPVIALAVLFPGAGDRLRGVPGLTTVLVAFLLFLSGFCLDLKRLRESFSRIGAMLLSLLTTYVVVPICALGIAISFAPFFDESASYQLFLQGLMLAAAQSSTLASAPTLTRIAGGNGELSLLLTLISSVAMPLLTPAVLRLSTGSEVSLSYGEMALRIFAVMMVPAICGQILRRVWKSYRGAHDSTIRIAQQLVILFFMFLGVAAAVPHFKEDPQSIWVCFLAVLLLHLLVSSWCVLSGKYGGHDGPTQVSLYYGGSQKSVPNGIYLWQVYFAANPIGAVPLVLHQIIQLISGFLLLPRMSRIASQGDDSGSSSTSSA